MAPPGTTPDGLPAPMSAAAAPEPDDILAPFLPGAPAEVIPFPPRRRGAAAAEGAWAASA